MGGSRKIARSVVLMALLLFTSLPFEAPLMAGKKEKVSVLYAGALNYVNENLIGPAFSARYGYGYLGEGHGSLVGARLIKEGLRYPDIFQSADAKVNENELMGTEKGNFVSWYLTFLANEMVIIYHAKSRFSHQFSMAKEGKIKWYEVLSTPGLRFGRTDPDLDPKGYRTLFLMELAEEYYHDSTIRERILGNVHNSKQIFRETELLARLESGQIDAASGYKNEAVERNLPFLMLPHAINLGSSEFATFYRTVSYTSDGGRAFYGSPILFTVTIPRTARNQKAAIDFLSFVLSEEGQGLYRRGGFGKARILVGGDKAQVPLPLQKYIQGELDER